MHFDDVIKCVFISISTICAYILSSILSVYPCNSMICVYSLCSVKFGYTLSSIVLFTLAMSNQNTVYRLISCNNNCRLYSNVSQTLLLYKAVNALRWWRHQMETFPALLTLCAGNSPVTDGFHSQRPVTRSFDVSFGLHLDKRLTKQSRRRWFETPSRSLGRYCIE